jgi:hypothetical protein
MQNTLKEIQVVMHMILNFTYDPCAHRGLARLHRNQECKSQVEPAKDKKHIAQYQNLDAAIPNQLYDRSSESTNNLDIIHDYYFSGMEYDLKCNETIKTLSFT